MENASRYSFEWPSNAQVLDVPVASTGALHIRTDNTSMINEVKAEVATMAGIGTEDVKVVVSPYRVCPLGAHIDHQGGSVTAMALDKGVLLGFVASCGDEIFLRSKQFNGDVRFRMDTTLSKGSNHRELHWSDYVRGAVFALRKKGYTIEKGISGYIDGQSGLHGAGISSSAAVGISFLLALECVNGLDISPLENIQLDRSIENDYLGLRNGILDQSAILLSKHNCLTVIHCKDQSHELVSSKNSCNDSKDQYKILLAFSGLRHALVNSTSYNSRVAECQEAADLLLKAIGRQKDHPKLSDVSIEEYEKHKAQLHGANARRAEHYFSECKRVYAGIEAWKDSNLQEFGMLMSESGRSSIENYECGCEPMIELLEIVKNAPGIFGARFSGAGFRGCCVGLVAAELAETAAKHIHKMYAQAYPELVKFMEEDGYPVLICGTTDHARILVT